MIKIVDKYLKTILTVEVNGNILTSTGTAHSSREVYLFEDFVVKIESLLEDCQNEDEIATYNKILDEDKKYFAEILDSGYYDESYSFLVQKRVELSEAYPTEAQKKLLDNLTFNYNLGDIHFGEPSSHWKTCNHNITPVGEDSLVIYDLGCC